MKKINLLFAFLPVIASADVIFVNKTQTKKQSLIFVDEVPKNTNAQSAKKQVKTRQSVKPVQIQTKQEQGELLFQNQAGSIRIQSSKELKPILKNLTGIEVEEPLTPKATIKAATPVKAVVAKTPAEIATVPVKKIVATVGSTEIKEYTEEEIKAHNMSQKVALSPIEADFSEYGVSKSDQTTLMKPKEFHEKTHKDLIKQVQERKQNELERSKGLDDVVESFFN